MKKVIALLSAFSMSAQAHDSLVPHGHPHELSMLARTDVIVICLLLALSAALIAYWRFRRAP